jgi:hypothetical protein
MSALRIAFDNSEGCTTSPSLEMLSCVPRIFSTRRQVLTVRTAMRIRESNLLVSELVISPSSKAEPSLPVELPSVYFLSRFAELG